MAVKTLVVVAALICQSASWDYSNTDWSGTAAICGSGTRQSPVPINDCGAVYDGSLGAITFSNYDTTLGSMTLKNSGGHTAQVDITSDHSIYGGGLSTTYKVAQLHFHWGYSDTTGSEHTLDSTQYPLEVHIVHYKSSFRSLSDAVSSGASDALAVVGAFYEVSTSDNAGLANIVTGLSSIQAADATTSVSGFSLADVTFSDIWNQPFYRYEGSLTTPSCNEIVIWTVLQNRIPISSTQLSAFRSRLNDPSGNTLTFNYRPVQNIYTRTIKKNTSLAPKMESMNCLLVTGFVLVVALFRDQL